MKVSELIDPQTKKWDSNMLNGLFTPQEVELIQSIPLCPNAVEDTLVWPFTPSGNYTMKLGTRFITAEQATTPHEVSAQPGNAVWKLIWSLNVQSKVRNFLWRTCHNALPVKQNLRRRHIINEDVCDLCKHETETVFHALWGCEQLSQVWGTLSTFSFRQTRTFSSIQELITYTNKEQKNLELLASVMWTDSPIPRARWSPPAEGEIKVNFDGAQFKDMGKAGLGVVIRNSRGQALASLSEQAPLPFSPDITEALAAARAISFAQELGFTSFILEGDSANIINTLKSEEPSLSSFDHILSSAKSMMTDGNISFSHVGRTGNMVAHNLAKHARHVRGFSVWMENIPPHLSHVLYADYG